MPLHLLGKKSWNVYNTENIARVRRDEAEAQAREAEEERRQRAEDGETRLAQLRGAHPVDHKLTTTSVDDGAKKHESRLKKRKLAGEDDTDRDIRLAQLEKGGLVDKHLPTAPVTDSRGHIDLVQHKTSDTNKSKSRTEDEQANVGVRLADASGRGPQSGNPWYSSASVNGPAQEAVGRDVWGNEDPRRHEREQRRMDANDPLAAMKKGVKQLRHAEAQRQEWKSQRERDLEEVEELARRERKRHRSRRDEQDSLDGFDLDAGYVVKHDAKGRSDSHHKDRDNPRHSRHHRRHHRSRSRSPRRRKERRRSHDAPAPGPATR